MSTVEDLRGELTQILDGVSKETLEESSYFKAIDRPDGILLYFPNEIARPYLRAVRALRNKAENLGVRFSNSELEAMLNDLLFEIKYGDETEARGQIDTYITGLFGRIKNIRYQRYLFLIPIMHLRLEQDIAVGTSRIVNMTGDVLKTLESAHSAKIGIGDDDPLETARRLTEINETSTFAVVVVEAADDKKALELASEKAEMCLNALRLYSSQAPFVVRGEFREEVLKRIVHVNIDEKTSGEQTSRLNLVANVPTIDSRTIEAMKTGRFDTVNELLRRDPNKLTDLEKDVLTAIFWFGSAVKEPSRRMGFMKSVFALETLLLPDGGLGKKARISRRLAAVLYADATDDVKREVYREMYGLYGIRNSVIHSGEGYVHQDDLNQTMMWAQALVQFLLRYAGKFKHMSELLEREFPVDDSLYIDST